MRACLAQNSVGAKLLGMLGFGLTAMALTNVSFKRLLAMSGQCPSEESRVRNRKESHSSVRSGHGAVTAQGENPHAELFARASGDSPDGHQFN
jgi:hypothetical protein